MGLGRTKRKPVVTASQNQIGFYNLLPLEKSPHQLQLKTDRPVF